MHVRQRLSQGVVETPVGAGNRFGARPLDGVEGGHNDRLPPQVLDQGSGQHDALVVCMASSVSNWTACRSGQS
ncbi:Uncharacterised protein [Escherichia coli]|uniref:Uncharacterized protein n=1 Tax=Escherichia coli TaxID=562 RepID=A0A377BCX8_ECOLX|nr:Uncharacterised protein [Escherichia coli]